MNVAKSQEELNQIKNEYENLTTKLKELSEEELNVVTGGEVANIKILTRGSTAVGLQTTTVEPSQPEKQYCQMIACQYTKESCIKKNIGIDNFYCDKFHQFVKDFD